MNDTLKKQKIRFVMVFIAIIMVLVLIFAYLLVKEIKESEETQFLDQQIQSISNDNILSHPSDTIPNVNNDKVDEEKLQEPQKIKQEENEVIGYNSLTENEIRENEKNNETFVYDEPCVEMVAAEPLLNVGIVSDVLESIPYRIYDLLHNAGIFDVDCVILLENTLEVRNGKMRCMLDTDKDEYPNIILTYLLEDMLLDISLSDYSYESYQQVMDLVEEREMTYDDLYDVSYDDELTEKIIDLVNYDFFMFIGKQKYDYAAKSLMIHYIETNDPELEYGKIEYINKCLWIRDKLGCDNDTYIHPQLKKYYIFDDCILVKEKLLAYKVSNGKRISGNSMEIWITLVETQNGDYKIVFEDMLCNDIWRDYYKSYKQL